MGVNEIPAQSELVTMHLAFVSLSIMEYLALLTPIPYTTSSNNDLAAPVYSSSSNSNLFERIEEPKKKRNQIEQRSQTQNQII